ncbi:methyltransferase domain-containing protein [Marivivens marinus]|uniref:class I SAM-dependent DNA methyltransferase n=1 Tax=Marivivens marinus TaxID=3110173 RepID=UPI003B849AE1
MSPIPNGSSGDLNADRRLMFADALLAEGDPAAAAALMSETLPDFPDWVAGWMRLGEMAEAAGDTSQAIAAYETALRLDPADLHGAGLRRDLLRPVPVAEQMPPAFVEALFDQYAPGFDRSLVDGLAYSGPEQLAACLPGPYARALDLGCGTGLMGAAIRDRCTWLEGWDISAGMLERARAKAIYDRLDKQDIGALTPVHPQFDLIVAADVFIYLGALERIIGWVAAALAPGGTFAFTVEATEDPGFILRPSRRYAHGQAYLSELLATAGFVGMTMDRRVLRKDRGEDVEALIVTAKAPVRRRDTTGEEAEFA